MAAIFNRSIFNNAIFNTEAVGPIYIIEQGGVKKHKKPKKNRIVVNFAGVDHVIEVENLQQFLDYAKNKIDPGPVRIISKKGSKQLVIDNQPPEIVVKSVPSYAIPDVSDQIAKANEIMVNLWKKARKAYLQELEDEEALIVVLMCQ